MSRKAWIVVGVLGGLAVLGCGGVGLAVWLLWSESSHPLPRHVVEVAWPGASVQEIDEALCRPLARRVGESAGVVRAVSVSADGECVVEAQLEEDGAADALGSIAARLAADVPGAETPRSRPAPTGAVVDFVVVADLEMTGTSWIFEERVRPAIERIDGVESVSVCGAWEPGMRVQVDAARAIAMDVSLEAIASALREDAVVIPVRPEPGPVDVEGLGAIPVAPSVRLSDVADIHSGMAPPDCAAHWDGRRVVAGRARLGPEVSRESVAAALAELAFDEGVHLDVVAEAQPVRVVLPPGVAAAELEHMTSVVESTVGGGAHLVRTIERGPDPFDASPWSRLGHPSIVVHHPEPERAVMELATLPGYAHGGAPRDLVVWVTAADHDTLVAESARIHRDVGEIAGTLGVAVHGVTDTDEVKLEVDPERAERLGVNVTTIARAVRAATGGLDVMPGVELHAGEGADDLQALESLVLRGADGVAVPLTQVASLSYERRPRALLSVDGRPAVALRIAAQPENRAAVRQALADLELGGGVALEIE